MDRRQERNEAKFIELRKQIRKVDNITSAIETKLKMPKE